MKTINSKICKCGCGAALNKKHPNANFLNQRHKDKFWNTVNPRGKFAPLHPMKRSFHWGDRHPFDIEE